MERDEFKGIIKRNIDSLKHGFVFSESRCQELVEIAKVPLRETVGEINYYDIRKLREGVGALENVIRNVLKKIVGLRWDEKKK